MAVHTWAGPQDQVDQAAVQQGQLLTPVHLLGQPTQAAGQAAPVFRPLAVVQATVVPVSLLFGISFNRT